MLGAILSNVVLHRFGGVGEVFRRLQFRSTDGEPRAKKDARKRTKRPRRCAAFNGLVLMDAETGWVDCRAETTALG